MTLSEQFQNTIERGKFDIPKTKNTIDKSLKEEKLISLRQKIQ